MANLICLGAGLEGVPILERAKALGHTLIVVDGNAAAPGMALADVPVVASCYDAAATVDAINLGYHPDGVLCCAVDAPHVAAFVAQEFDLPGLTPEQAELSIDKYQQKRVLRDAGLPVPDFWEVARGWSKDQRLVMGSWSNKDISGWDHWHTQSIIKPRDSRGARGVTLLPLKPDSQQIADAISEAEAQSSTSRAVIEEYLPGPQLSTESIVVEGRVKFTAVALRNYDRLAEFAPHIIEDGFDMPYGDAALWAEVDDVIERGCAALGWRTLTVKADLIIHDGRVVILELAARLSGGFLSTHGTALAYHFPFVEAAITMAVRSGPRFVAGHPYQLDDAMRPIPDYVCQRYLFGEHGEIGKRVVEVPRLTPVANMLPAGIAELFGMGSELGNNSRWAVGESGPLDSMFTAAFATYAIRPGDVLRPVTDHGARLGQAIATGSTPAAARARVEAAVSAMKAAIRLE